MSVYCITGKLGNGKTLVSVGRIRDALKKGRRVATNLDINLLSMAKKETKNINLIRIPDKPTVQDLEAIGKGFEGDYDEEKFGILVLDECGTWFNSRNWQDKERRAVNDWFLHARKLGWHVYIIIQDISILDSQARDAICELLVTCRRLDKLRVPFLAPIVKTFTGINLTFPRIHRAKVTYADGLLSDVWTYRGNDLFAAYDTRQTFLQSYPHGTHSILTPWHTHGRYSIPMTWNRFMRLTKIHWKRFKSPVALATGLLLGISFAMVHNANEIEHNIVKYQLQKSEQQLQKVPEKHPVKLDSKPDPSKEQLPGPAPVPTQETKITAFVNQLKIIGSYQLDNLKLYTFATGEPDRYLTSRDISSMGLAVRPITDCMVEVTFNDTKSLVRCL
ncbi:MAG: assembly protein [Gammaproteobacteria bacterium]|nr:MAG: assembly protein [Gammaproteobacteria bacterium]